MIFEIYNIFLEINSYFESSTLPKFLKRIICRSRIRRLTSCIKKAKKLVYYGWSDIYMLLKYIEIHDDITNDSYYTFTISNDDGTADDIEISFNQETEDMDVVCVIRSADGNSIRSSMLNIKDTNIYRNTSDISAKALGDINDIMRVYLDKFAEDLKERSERIYTS